jgi:chromosome segregation ATPase
VEHANKRAAALTAYNKEYEERLENEKPQIASLKEQVEHSEKRIKSFEMARKSESKLLSRLLQSIDDWAVADLKSIAKSLKTRLDALKTQFQVGGQPSTAQDLAQDLLPFLLNEDDPSKEDLLRTIETIDSELTEVESAVPSLSTSDTVIPEATRALDESPENASRKRARVSISPA